MIGGVRPPLLPFTPVLPLQVSSPTIQTTPFWRPPQYSFLKRSEPGRQFGSGICRGERYLMHTYLCRLLRVDNYALEINIGLVSMQNHHMALKAISVSSQYYNAIPTRLSSTLDIVDNAQTIYPCSWVLSTYTVLGTSLPIDRLQVFAVRLSVNSHQRLRLCCPGNANWTLCDDIIS
jgi:hypothetical protein